MFNKQKMFNAEKLTVPYPNRPGGVAAACGTGLTFEAGPLLTSQGYSIPNRIPTPKRGREMLRQERNYMHYLEHDLGLEIKETRENGWYITKEVTDMRTGIRRIERHRDYSQQAMPPMMPGSISYSELLREGFTGSDSGGGGGGSLGAHPGSRDFRNVIY